MQETSGLLPHQAILDTFPDAVVWLLPVSNTEGDVDDFRVVYANNRAVEGLDHDATSIGAHL